MFNLFWLLIKHDERDFLNICIVIWFLHWVEIKRSASIHLNPSIWTLNMFGQTYRLITMHFLNHTAIILFHIQRVGRHSWMLTPPWHPPHPTVNGFDWNAIIFSIRRHRWNAIIAIEIINGHSHLHMKW